MDVRCAQCQAEYELDDTLVAERGTAVCCTRCGFRFRAYRPAGASPSPERWAVKTASGATLTFLSLRELQEAIVLRRVGPHDALTRGPGAARSLASIVEFRSLFEAARRGSEGLAQVRPSMPTPAGLGGPPVSLPPERPADLAVALPPGLLDPTLPTPPAGLVVPRRASAASMPSLRQTIRFGEDGPVREAFEAAMGARDVAPGEPGPRAEGPAPRPSDPSRLFGAPQVTAGETTAPLFVGRPPPSDVTAPLAVGPALDGLRPSGRAELERLPEGPGANAATPQAFVAAGVVGGSSRPPPPPAPEAGDPWRRPAPPSSWPAPAPATDERAAGGDAPGTLPWSTPRPPAAPPLRWFVAAAAVFALVAGTAVRKGLAPADPGAAGRAEGAGEPATPEAPAAGEPSTPPEATAGEPAAPREATAGEPAAPKAPAAGGPAPARETMAGGPATPHGTGGGSATSRETNASEPAPRKAPRAGEPGAKPARRRARPKPAPEPLPVPPSGPRRGTASPSDGAGAVERSNELEAGPEGTTSPPKAPAGAAMPLPKPAPPGSAGPAPGEGDAPADPPDSP